MRQLFAALVFAMAGCSLSAASEDGLDELCRRFSTQLQQMTRLPMSTVIQPFDIPSSR